MFPPDSKLQQIAVTLEALPFQGSVILCFSNPGLPDKGRATLGWNGERFQRRSPESFEELGVECNGGANTRAVLQDATQSVGKGVLTQSVGTRV